MSAQERAYAEGESLGARLGTLPFAERLKIENERLRRTDAELERHAAEGPRPSPRPSPVPNRTPSPTRFPELPPVPPSPKDEATRPVRTIAQTLAVPPGSMLDLFA